MHNSISTASGIKTLSDEITEALTAIAQKHGLTIKSDLLKYDPTGIKAQIRLAVTEAGADPTLLEAERTWSEWQALKLVPDVLGKTYYCPKNGIMTVRGYLSRRAKPVLVTDSKGKKFLTTVPQLRAAFRLTA